MRSWQTGNRRRPSSEEIGLYEIDLLLVPGQEKIELCLERVLFSIVIEFL